MARLRHRIEIMQQIQNGKARNAIIAKPIGKNKINRIGVQIYPLFG